MSPLNALHTPGADAEFADGLVHLTGAHLRLDPGAPPVNDDEAFVAAVPAHLAADDRDAIVTENARLGEAQALRVAKLLLHHLAGAGEIVARRHGGRGGIRRRLGVGHGLRLVLARGREEKESGQGPHQALR
jgi:hypothetical protein